MLLKTITKNLPKGMYIPQPLEMLFKWMELNNLVTSDDKGELRGYLYHSNDEEKHESIYFSSGNKTVWHFRENNEAKERFYALAYVDDENDGCIGLWLDDEGEQHIVLIGDDISVPMPFCILADATTLLQLLAIGYCNIFSWQEHWGYGLDNAPINKSIALVLEYKKWVKETFNVTIPKTASEILPHFASINDENSSDKFLRWDREHNLLWKRSKYTKILYDKINSLFPELGLEKEGFYNYMTLSLFTELMYWLENDTTDTTDKEVTERVKELASWVYSIDQDPNDDFQRTHIFTEYSVSFLEDIYHNRKLHHLIPHMYVKEDVLNNKKFIMGYMHTSEENYLYVLSLYDEKEER